MSIPSKEVALQYHRVIFARDAIHTKAAIGGFTVSRSEAYYLASAIARLDDPRAIHQADGTEPLPSLDVLAEAYHEYNNLSGGNQQQLKRIVRHILERLCDPLPEARQQGELVFEAGDYCGFAERGFASACWQINGDDEPAQHQLISVYHTAAGLPVFLRKNTDVSTALVLESIDAGGLLVAPGTIAKLAADMDDHLTGEVTLGAALNRYKLRTYELPATAKFEAGRLSAWAFSDPNDRILFAIDHWDEDTIEYQATKTREVTVLELDDFRAAAAHVMELCGTRHTSATAEE